jgi:hypothetical protein
MAGVWLGLLVSLTFIAAPAAFALLDKPAAGILVGRLFAQEAALSALSSMVFVMILRRLSEHEASPRSPSPASDTRLWMVLGVLGCTVVGYYAMQPLLVAARVGQGALSFGLLHGISVAFFGLKMLLLLMLTWRLSC